MAWASRYSMYDIRRFESPSSLSANELCFIRKEHKCGKIFGASKSCFVACPTNDELEPILSLMSEKLSKVGIEPIIAVKERSYGQDIFCTKICGKIIESKFCVVILDDSVKDKVAVPNPNVYYEYGLMTSLKKHIVPLQRNDLRLAFNIQSHDTIKYDSRNISTEIDRAIKDAIRITESKEPDSKRIAYTDRTVLRKLELAGFEAKDDNWFLNPAIEDTGFKGFSHSEKRFYLLLAKVDEPGELQDRLEDLGVVVFRIEKKASELEERLSSFERRFAYFEKQAKEGHGLTSATVANREADRTQNEINETKSKLELLGTVFVGFLMDPRIQPEDFQLKVESLLRQHERYRHAVSGEDTIQLGDVTVSLTQDKF